MRCTYLTQLIDQKVSAEGGTPRHPARGLRHHLGASIIGRECYRELWYSFRWATNACLEGRVLRLFDRGHEEESRFVDWLEMVGAKVQRFDPRSVYQLWYHPESDAYLVYEPGAYVGDNTAAMCVDVSNDPLHLAAAIKRGYEIPEPRQFGFKGINGHFAGSMDGIASQVPYQVEHLGCSFYDQILVEFKTHGEKSFVDLVAKDSVQKAKLEHYIQMIIYMDEYKLPGGLYGAVNKNTDELYWEFVLPNPRLAEEVRQKALVVIHSYQPPPRISNSPSWYICKFCTHRPTCHFGAPLAKSCRTCVASLPIENGRWFCQHFNRTIPENFEEVGCDYWKMIHD